MAFTIGDRVCDQVYSDRPGTVVAIGPGEGVVQVLWDTLNDVPRVPPTALDIGNNPCGAMAEFLEIYRDA